MTLSVLMVVGPSGKRNSIICHVRIATDSKLTCRKMQDGETAVVFMAARLHEQLGAISLFDSVDFAPQGMAEV